MFRRIWTHSASGTVLNLSPIDIYPLVAGNDNPMLFYPTIENRFLFVKSLYNTPPGTTWSCYLVEYNYSTRAVVGTNTYLPSGDNDGSPIGYHVDGDFMYLWDQDNSSTLWKYNIAARLLDSYADVPYTTDNYLSPSYVADSTYLYLLGSENGGSKIVKVRMSDLTVVAEPRIGTTSDYSGGIGSYSGNFYFQNNDGLYRVDPTTLAWVKITDFSVPPYDTYDRGVAVSVVGGYATLLRMDTTYNPDGSANYMFVRVDLSSGLVVATQAISNTMLGYPLFFQNYLLYPFSYWNPFPTFIVNGFLQVDPTLADPSVYIPIDFGATPSQIFIVNGYGNTVVNDQFILVGVNNYTAGSYLIAKCPGVSPWPDPITVDPPVVSFTGVPLTGMISFDVVFTDASTGYINSWSWDFGDGGTSTSQNPTHTYSVAGTYTVSLTVTGPGGSTTFTQVGYITATPYVPSRWLPNAGMQLYLAFWNGDYVDHSVYGWNITTAPSVLYGSPIFVPNGLQFNTNGQYIRWGWDGSEALVMKYGITKTWICWIRSDAVNAANSCYWGIGPTWHGTYTGGAVLVANLVGSNSPVLASQSYTWASTVGERFNGDGVWHHVAIAKNTTTNKSALYVDGVKCGERTDSAGYNSAISRNTDYIDIGASDFTTTGPVPTKIYPKFTFGEWRIYTTQYLAADILADYNNTKTWYGL